MPLSKIDPTMENQGPAFAAYPSGVQSVPSGALTKIVLNTEEYDTNNAFDSATNSRFQPTVAGVYLFTGSVTFSGQSSTLSALYKNGAEIRRGVFGGSAVNSLVSSVVSGMVNLNGSTDYVELYGYQGSGGAVNTVAGASQTYLQGVLVRPT